MDTTALRTEKRRHSCKEKPGHTVYSTVANAAAVRPTTSVATTLTPSFATSLLPSPPRPRHRAQHGEHRRLVRAITAPQATEAVYTCVHVMTYVCNGAVSKHA